MPEPVDTDTRAFDDADSLGGRIKRYAQVGTAMGGIAARYAGGRFLGMPLDNLAHAGELKAALGGLKGPLMKVAQILATVPDMLPEEYTAELTQLQTNAPSMGWAFVKRRMNAELGPDWQSRFASFEHNAAAAASLGQVHRAESHDGQRLACKLQYPDMRSAVEADLRQLKLIFSIYRRYDKAIDPSNIHTELSERLREELDYEREARHMALYSRMLADEPGVHVPETVAGAVLRPAVDHDVARRRADHEFRRSPHRGPQHGRAQHVPGVVRAVLRIRRAARRPASRQLHGPSPTASVNLLDFGCIRVFRPDFIRAVIDLYWSLRNDDRRPGGSCLRDLGLQEPQPRRDRHPQPVGHVPVPAADGGSGADHPGGGRHHVRREGRRQGPAGAPRRGRRDCRHASSC